MNFSGLSIWRRSRWTEPHRSKFWTKNRKKQEKEEMWAMAVAMAMPVSSPASPSPPTVLSLPNRQHQSSISCIHLPSLSRSSPPSLSHTFNPLRYTLPPFSSQSLTLFSFLTLLFRFKVLHRSPRNHKLRQIQHQ